MYFRRKEFSTDIHSIDDYVSVVWKLRLSHWLPTHFHFFNYARTESSLFRFRRSTNDSRNIYRMWSPRSSMAVSTEVWVFRWFKSVWYDLSFPLSMPLQISNIRCDILSAHMRVHYFISLSHTFSSSLILSICPPLPASLSLSFPLNLTLSSFHSFSFLLSYFLSFIIFFPPLFSRFLNVSLSLLLLSLFFTLTHMLCFQFNQYLLSIQVSTSSSILQAWKQRCLILS